MTCAATLVACAINAAPPAPPAPPAAPAGPAQEGQPTNSDAAAIALAAKSLGYADPKSLPGHGVFSAADEAFLDDLERRGVQFFIDEADPETGLMPDRAHANGGASNEVASTASIGFGLTALCIGESRGWIPRQEAYDRSLRVLKFLRDKAPQEHGHFYHFLNMHTGVRTWECEVSNVDTALLMYGVLVVRQHFPDSEVAKIADELYRAVDWPWLMKEDGTLRMGWKPEGFLDATWGDFSEGPPLILLLGMASPTHPLPPTVWQAWKREPVMTYAGLTFVQCPPLFTHQFPQCWFDLRGLTDGHLDHFRNGQLATIAQRQWMSTELHEQYPTYGPNLWGLTASDYQDGYTAWGGPPQQGDVNGTVVPCAAGGSLAFEPRLSVDALKHMKAAYGEKAYRKYGFVDAFNPSNGWVNKDVIGIDVGPTVLMAENARTGFVWKTFMSTPEAQAALKLAGFRALTADERRSPQSSIFNTDADGAANGGGGGPTP